MYGIAAGETAPLTLLMGGVIRGSPGIGVGILLYRGLLKIPGKPSVSSYRLAHPGTGCRPCCIGCRLSHTWADVLPYQAPL